MTFCSQDGSDRVTTGQIPVT